MARIRPIETEHADGKTKSMLENVRKSLGMVPNLMRTLANSPATLEAYLAFGKALGGGSLSAKLREQIALTAANANACEYCASAHTALGQKFGIDESELQRNLQASSHDPKIEAALHFAKAVLEKKGGVSDEELDRVREAGYSDGEIGEIIATTAHSIFTNYFNHVAKTEVDFPLVEIHEPATA